MKRIILILALSLIITSCLKHKAIKPVDQTTDTTSVDSCADTVYFNAEIMNEIFTPSCNVSGCHNSIDAASGYDLTNYTNVSASSNIILKSIQQVNGVSPMPLGSNKLNDSLINKFDCWIQQGKLNN